MTEKQEFLIKVFEDFESKLNQQGISDENQVMDLFLEAMKEIHQTPKEQFISELTGLILKKKK